MKVKKFLILILIFTILIAMFSTQHTQASWKNIINSADSFLNNGSSANNGPAINTQNVKNVSGSIYNSLLIVGVGVAMIIGVVLGIQFMTGSVEQKSKVKESLIPYFAGCAVIFGAFGIWKIVISILNTTA